MTIGQKIKQARISARLTQSDLAGNQITRNMLSAIECDRALPSLDTLKHISRMLDIPLPYFLSEENDLFFFRKKERIAAIKNAFESRNYNACISLIMKLDTLDDELYFILAECYFNLGKEAVKNGSLDTAEKNLLLCRDYCDRTMYDTKRFENIIPLYLAIASNVNSPLLEFDENAFVDGFEDAFEYEFYKYLTLDYDFPFKHFQFKTHIDAKKIIKERKYADALKLLLLIDETKTEYPRNTYLMFGVYSDLELCYKQLFDFESAYRYASKRLSLLEGFTV